MKRVILASIILMIFLTACNTITGNAVAENTGLKVEISESNSYVTAGEKIWFTIILEDELLESNISVELIHNGNVINEFLVNTSGENNLYLSLDVPEDMEGSSQIKVDAQSDNLEVSDSENFVVVRSTPTPETESEENVISMSVDIPKEYQQLYSGEDVLASIKLINHGSKGRVDVHLETWIENDQKEIMVKNKETVAVETQANFVRTMTVPDSPPGEYSAYAQITYADGKSAQAHQEFIVAKKELFNKYVIYGSIAVILLAIIITIISVLKSKGVFKRAAIRSRVDRIVKRRKLK